MTSITMSRFSGSLHLAWSFAERTLPRAASAVLLLSLAYFVQPAIVGLYSWAVLGVTVYQALTDEAVRQVAVPALHSPSGEKFFRIYPWVASATGVLFIGIVIEAIWILAPLSLRPQALMLLPLAAVPIATNLGIISVAKLQVAHRWSRLASGQFTAALVSLSITLPVMILTRSVLACALQLLLTETIFAIWCIRASRNLTPTFRGQSGRGILGVYFGMSGYGLLGWGQGQADRLLIGSVAGTATLGFYSTATSIARSLGDSMAAATANVLRARISLASPPTASEIRTTSHKVIIAAGFLGGASIIAVWLGTRFFLERVLSDAWMPALRAVPIVALSTIPSIVTWSLTTVVVARGRSLHGIPVRFLGVLMAIPIALSATVSLELAAWIVVARDTFIMFLVAAIGGNFVPWKAIMTLFGITILLAIPVGLLR